MNVLPIRTGDSKKANTKFAGFDAVRAVAALGVVLLHSCVPYLRHPMPGLAWPVRDSQSSIVDSVFWFIELFIMPLFLVMAGFLAWQTLERRGAGSLIKSRAQRLLKPLFFGAIVVLPLDLYAWLLGWVAEGLIPPVKLRSLKFDGGIDHDLWGLSHLWFLQYLFLYVVVVAVVVATQRRFSWSFGRFGLRQMVASLVIVGSLVLYLRPEVVWGFQHSFLPVFSKWLYSGLFFLLGVVLARDDGQLVRLQSAAGRLLGPALVTSLAAVALGQWHLGGGEQDLAQFVLAILTSFSALLITLATIGMAVKRVDRLPSLLGYLAASSFWVYLVHHPVVGLVHLDLKWLLPEANPLLKTGLAFVVTSSFCLLTYEGLVRRTALGRWLGFAWHPAASEQGPSDTEILEMPDVRDPESPAGTPLPAARKAA